MHLGAYLGVVCFMFLVFRRNIILLPWCSLLHVSCLQVYWASLNCGLKVFNQFRKLYFQTLLKMFFIQIWCFLLQCRGSQFDSWVGKIHWRRGRLPTPVFLGFPCDSAGKGSACNVGDLGLIPGLGRSPGEGKGYPLQFSGPESSMDCTAKSQTWLRDFHFTSWCFSYNINAIFSNIFPFFLLSPLLPQLRIHVD